MSTQYHSLFADVMLEKAAEKASQAPSELWFYLLDQYTMEPILLAAGDKGSDRYPIQISMPSEFIQSWLPLIMTSLSVLKGANSIAGIARLLGYPVPDLKNFLDSADRYVTEMDKNARVNASIMVGGKEANASRNFFRGSQLNDLKAFYESNDCADIADICSLKSVMSKNGYRCWTVGENKDALSHQDVHDSKQGEVVSHEKSEGDDEKGVPTATGNSFLTSAVEPAEVGMESDSANPPKKVDFKCNIWKNVSHLTPKKLNILRISDN